VDDWRSYDNLADCYDEIWGPRFEEVSRRIWALVSPPDHVCSLDVGTGTGAVPITLREFVRHQGLTVGCDCSVGMLRRAARRVPGLHAVAADATALPFADGIFDVVTASFVLSHILDDQGALREVFRVLKPSGIAVLSNWGPVFDPYGPLWSELLASVISRSAVDDAIRQIAPNEAVYSKPEGLEAALSSAGFVTIRTQIVELVLPMSPDLFIKDRELSSAGRLGFHILGPAAWSEFRMMAVHAFEQRFGKEFIYKRQALISLGRKTV
jgi:demethylmenaquinone methyltransferase / 2-methoxy-6-polyprenyl-1,4-benzoquinol methylase